jgi:selenocysteine lyase/cysteine desulfurase
MKEDFSRDFGPFNGQIWLNCAHQGALPRVAVQEVYEAVSWKISPYHLTTARFDQVPQRLKAALAELVGARADEIVLANSNSYGLHLLANGIPWREGDEILLVEGDFPSDILPWLALENRGVKIRYIRPRNHVPEPDELQANVTASTRLFCTTWVHSFSGWAVDAEALGTICRASDITFVLNASQALGARPLRVSSTPVDAVTSVGFKWLCGPYGTGFLWLRPDLRESLIYNQAYWRSMQTADDLGETSKRVAVGEGLGARKYDVFGTANFFNFKPWSASVEYLLRQGIERIEAYDQRLIARLLETLDGKRYVLISPRSGSPRSTLVLFSHKDPDRNREIHEALRRAGVHIAYRRGNLRIAPHLYNTEDEIERAVSLLNSFA